MKGFELYSVSTWTDDGLSIHPPVTPTANQTRPFRGYFARIAMPLLALTASGIATGAIAGSSVSVAQKVNVTSISSPLPTFSRAGSLITQATFAPKPQSLKALPADHFAEEADKLLTHLYSNSYAGISSETLKLAAEATLRHADTHSSDSPAWVQGVANAVAQLDD
jgi:hypothetical protein